MAFLGLVPREWSTGDTVRRAGLTLAGNRYARRVLVETAWSYRHPARVSNTLHARLLAHLFGEMPADFGVAAIGEV